MMGVGGHDQHHHGGTVLPLLYHPATSQHEGAGYSSPVSSSSAVVDFFDGGNAMVGTPDGLLPSALTTPSAGAISIRPGGPMGVGGGGSRGGARGGRAGVGQQQQQQQGGSLLAGGGSAGAGAGAKSAAAARGSSKNQQRRAQQQQQREREQQQQYSGYESDSSSSSMAGGMGGAGNTVHLSANWLKPDSQHYFFNNEPLPPWAGGVARLLAATLAAGPGSGDGSSSGGGGGALGGRGSSACLNATLLLPLVFLLLDIVFNARLLLLWGVGPPPHVKLWPSYALLGLLCVPHLLVGAVLHARLLALACLPPALKAATISEQQLAARHILPPGSQVAIRCYSW